MKTLLSILGALVLFIALPAKADMYVMGGGSLSNFSELNTDNIGYSGEVGWTNGTFAVGVEVSNHMHLGNETLAAAVNGRFFLGDWVVKPYISGGLGATFEGDPLTQLGGGLLWMANETVGIYGGYEHRWYYDGFDDFGSAGDDGYAKVGLMLAF